MPNKKECTLDRAIESARCAGAHIEGDKEYKDPSKIVYHEKRVSSIPYEEYFPKTFGMGFTEKNCAWCGKVFIPTRPEYAWGECCSYTCSRRQDEQVREEVTNAREVFLLNPDTKEDVMKFKSAKEAAGFAGINAKDIRLVCNGLRKTAGKYAWRWADEEPLGLVDIIPGYAEEPKKSIAVWVRESTHKKIKELAKKKGETLSSVVCRMVEKELNKEYEL